MNELWAIIPTHDKYEASSLGRIRRSQTGRILSEHRINGYSAVTLGPRQKIRRAIKVHKLVLAAFVGVCGPGLICRHLDDNKRNNALPNLAYGTHTQNQLDRIANGRGAIGENGPKAKLSYDDVLFIRESYRHLGHKQSNSAELAARFGVTRSTITTVVNGKSWSKRDVLGPAHRAERQEAPSA